MRKRAQDKDARTVSRIKPRKNVRVGKPGKLSKTAQRSVFAAHCGPPAYMSYGGGGGGASVGGGFGGGLGYTGRGGGGFGGGGSTIEGSGGNFYSPELSTDFLELPQSIDEKRNTFRFFYRTDPFVAQAVDLHVELPLSKIRWNKPKYENPESEELANQAYRFVTRWSRNINLLQKLIYIVHDYTLLGEAFAFAEDNSPDMPREVTHKVIRVLDEEEGAVEKFEEYEDSNERAIAWLKQNYHGWTDIKVIPPERMMVRSFSFTDEKIYELIADADSKKIVEEALNGSEQAERIVNSMPQEIVQSIVKDENIPLNTDPDAGSHIAHLTRKKSYYETHGHSILERILRILIYRDKLRQAQTSIASRHMTPIRLVWVEDGSIYDVEALREQVDLALMDPDYSIITNYEVRWEEMGADQRLLDLSTEYDMTDRQMYAGLGVTESLLSGESSYSGDRINLEVINTRFMLLRETIQSYVEDYLVKPMCRRMGFVEEVDGHEEVLYPTLSFTRLALRDNADTFDALFNLYQKGSVDIDVILELLNIDPDSTTKKVEEHVMTFKDSLFNEVLRGMYSDVGRQLAENSNLAEILADKLGLDYEPPQEGGGRF